MNIREAVRSDLPAIVSLLHEDVIREVDESRVPAEAYAAAFQEITADSHQQLLVGELDDEVVATGQLTWVRHLTYVGGLMCQVESVRVRSQEFYQELGFVASHVGMKLYLGGEDR